MELPTELIHTLKNAKKALVLTGAGMSAESGVPTFRDAQNGLWERFRPEDLATPEAFEDHPQIVWDWYTERRNTIRQVSPHAGHAALVKMEQFFEAFQLVTQNVDGLHQQAGSTDVIELHGNILRTKCSVTGRVIDDNWLNSNPGKPPCSPHHALGLARPDVVWFGEALPAAAMERATRYALDCDVCFSVGTSTLVQPAASLPFVALNAGAVLVEINPTETSLSALAQFSLRATASEALSAIAAGMTLRI